VSDLGARVSSVALPLLVLAVTGSPAKLGIVAAAGSLPLLVLTVPAGALVDRWNRKRVMIVSDVARCLALTSIAVAVAAGDVTFAQIVVVALVEGTGFVFFSVAERSALPRVVRPEHLPDALARNQVREYTALLAGQPLGGVLFGIGRVVPFMFDAVSYFVSLCTVALLRTSFTRETTAAKRARLHADVREGLRWFWQQPFIRATSLLVTGSDFALNALYLVVIVVARERGASSALIGLMFVFLGAGGLLGSVAAPWLARRLEMRTVVRATQTTVALLVPLLAIVPGRLSPGVIYGAMFFLHPTWNATVGAYRLRATPDALQGRVSSIATLLSLGPVPVAALVAGFLLDAAGSTPTIVVLAGVMAVVAIASFASPAVRRGPEELPAEGSVVVPEASETPLSV
jgi:predicted MFS family arabinose efflux permease